MELTKTQRKSSFGADVTFYGQFIVVSPEVCTGWKTPPYFWLLAMCEAIKQQRPGSELLLMGFSKGAWWGGLFLALKPELFHGAVLMAGYSSPMHPADQRAKEGYEVAVAAAMGSRVHAVVGELDLCCPKAVFSSYVDAMREGGVRVHTFPSLDHNGVYDRIALGTKQDGPGNAVVLNECRRALIPTYAR